MHLETCLTVVCIILVSLWLIVKSQKLIRPLPNGHKIQYIEDLQFKSGDIILYHSNPFINWFTNSAWSHVSMVIIGRSGIPRLFEITGTSHYATAKILMPELKKELSDNNVVLGLRRLHPPPDEEKLRNFVVDTLQSNTHYEHVYWREFYQRLFGTFFPIKISNLDTWSNKSTICSSLIAEAYQYAGILSSSVHPLKILPADFGESLDRPLQFVKEFKLGPIIFLRKKHLT